MDNARFLTHSLQDQRITGILQATLNAVDPARIVREYFQTTSLPAHARLYLLGIGKAAEPMVAAAAEVFPDFTKALVITKQAELPERPRIDVMQAGHPVPDARSVMAGHAALDFAGRLNEDDLLLCLISGGGSSLAATPKPGVALRDLQFLTTNLLRSGASIEEINTLRRRLDAFKGGGLARATRANMLSLILSDVIGDRLEVISSGPTVPDPTSGADVLGILSKYGIQVPPNVYAVLAGKRLTGELRLARSINTVIGNNELAARAAAEEAIRAGLNGQLLRTDLRGEASDIGQRLGERLRRSCKDLERPFCLIYGGEATVTMHGTGKGGRNQELALAAVQALSGLKDAMLVSFATDGDDGPTDAAGAVVTGETADRARAAGMDALEYLARNDSYPYFEALGDLLKPGYTGTNVNDLFFLIGL